MAPAGDSTTSRGRCRLPVAQEGHHHDDRPAPARSAGPVTPAEISDLLGQALALPRFAPLADRIAWHERKAALLTRIAADLDTREAHEVAAGAWDQLRALAAELRGKADGGTSS